MNSQLVMLDDDRKAMLEVGKQRYPRIYNIHFSIRFSVRQSSRISQLAIAVPKKNLHD